MTLFRTLRRLFTLPVRPTPECVLQNMAFHVGEAWMCGMNPEEIVIRGNMQPQDSLPLPYPRATSRFGPLTIRYERTEP